MVRIDPITAGRGIDIGAAPSTARDESIGVGMRNLGNAIQGAGDVAMSHALRLEQQRQKMLEFETEQAWRRTQLDIAARYDEAKQGIDPSGAGFTEAVNKEFIARYDTFLQQVPEHLRPKFAELVATDQEGRMLQAAADEVAQRNIWYEVGITDTVNQAQTEVAAYPELFDQKLADVHRTIESSGLPPAKQADLKRAAEESLGRAWFERLVREDPSFAKTQLGVGEGATGDATGLIRSFEGFRETAYWDVNAYRTGYGSDTVTRADGTVEKVKPGTVVNREDAERDLKRRIGEFQGGIVRQVGVDAWANLPGNVRAGLTSVAYNYGSLPKSVVQAVKSGNVESIARAVEGLSGHNGGINASRRAKEAAVIRGAMSPAHEVANLPFNERVKLYDEAVRAEDAALRTEAAQSKALYDNEKGRLELAIQMGEVASRQTILDAPLSDSDKATLLSKWETQQNRDAAAQAVLDAYMGGTAGAANPYDNDQRKVVNDAFDLLMKSTPEDQRGAATVKFVETMGVVPPPVVAAVRRNLAASDAAMVAAGLSQAAGLYDVAPNGLAAVEHGKELSDAAATYRELVNGRGLSIEQAAAEVMRNRDPAQRQKAEVLDTAWKQAVKDEVFRVDDVLAAFDGGLFGGGRPSSGVTPAQQAALTADYLAAAERHFKGQANGDPALARQMAVSEMTSLYGVSEVSGARVLMKYAPEKFFPPRGGGHGYVRDLALKDARALLPDASNVMLVATPQTAQDVRAGRAPRYDLFYQTGDGVWDMAPDLFTIGPEEVTALDALDSEERAIRFQLERQAAEHRRANPRAPAAAGGMVPLVQMLGDAVTGQGFVPDAALTDQLQDVRSRRDTLLGRPEEFSRSYQDEIDAYQRQLESGSPLGGLPQ